jgi:tetratricopeptide (TPR) repeat protein
VIAFDQLRALQAAIAERPADAGASTLLADDDARGAVADRVLAPALELHPQHAGLWCTQAAWDSARGRLLPALRNYRRAQDADPQCIDAWLGAARLLRERENYTDAERYARLGLAQRPDPALRQELALALVQQGRLDDAILQLEAYLRVRPKDTDAGKVLANVLIGRAYARLSEPGVDAAEVLRIVQRALVWNPNEAKAHLVLGRLAREQRRFAEAVAHFEVAYRLLPEFEDTRQFLAESLADLGYERILQKDDQAAGDAFRRCLDVAPTGFPVDGVQLQLQAIWRRCEQRGVDRMGAGDRTGAVGAFRRCLQLDPTQHWAAWLLASALHDDPAVDLGELESLCRQAVAWQQQHGLDRSQQVYLLAATLAKAGKVEESQRFAREFLREPQGETKPAVLAALRQLAAE